MSTGSGLAGLVSGLGSISPGFNFLGSSPTSSSLSLCAALSLKTQVDSGCESTVCFCFTRDIILYVRKGHASRTAGIRSAPDTGQQYVL